MTDSVVALFANEPFDFKPGDAYRYNNSGYFLLGMIIEKLSGKPYGQYLKDEFFTPLGLKSTIYCDQAPLIKHRAQGYATRPSGGVHQRRAVEHDAAVRGGLTLLHGERPRRVDPGAVERKGGEPRLVQADDDARHAERRQADHLRFRSGHRHARRPRRR